MSSQQQLIDHALSKPDTVEDFPWGDRVAKVRGKVFVFFGRPKDGQVHLTVKLSASHADASTLPQATPTGYGLGKSGWLTMRFDAGDEPPVADLLAWIDESYALVAPKPKRSGRARPDGDTGTG